ncbi:hypothetical protein HYFRA_00009704 [Hymenoscyphus fraxineus]|uniref:Uncharacterized protein n=1 Tax=Hymenoscyphus fraxineus TaxID=746836 RepID=A0A9N9PRM5_9HELO|nr:hypothetical protein HYFRA_00009704 [Hymenoscyphus fraxineus]
MLNNLAPLAAVLLPLVTAQNPVPIQVIPGNLQVNPIANVPALPIFQPSGVSSVIAALPFDRVAPTDTSTASPSSASPASTTSGSDISTSTATETSTLTASSSSSEIDSETTTTPLSTSTLTSSDVSTSTSFFTTTVVSSTPTFTSTSTSMAMGNSTVVVRTSTSGPAVVTSDVRTPIRPPPAIKTEGSGAGGRADGRMGIETICLLMSAAFGFFVFA